MAILLQSNCRQVKIIICTNTEFLITYNVIYHLFRYMDRLYTTHKPVRISKLHWSVELYNLNGTTWTIKIHGLVSDTRHVDQQNQNSTDQCSLLMRTGLCVVYSLSIYLNLLDCPVYSLGLDRLNVPCMLKDHKSCIKRNKKWQSYFRVTVD
jgi:hypothetical protein